MSFPLGLGVCFNQAAFLLIRYGAGSPPGPTIGLLTDNTPRYLKDNSGHLLRDNRAQTPGNIRPVADNGGRALKDN